MAEIINRCLNDDLAGSNEYLNDEIINQSVDLEQNPKT